MTPNPTADGAMGSAAAAEPLGPTTVCRCGITVERWVRGKGFWGRFGWSFGWPVIGLALLGGCVLIGLAGRDLAPVVRGILCAVPVLVFAISWATQREHRGWCRVGRSAYFTLVGPGVLFGAVSSF